MKNVKNTVPWTYVISDLKGEEIIGAFYDVVKKNAYDKLVAKVNSIDTSTFVSKTKDDADKRELEKQIPDTGDLVKKNRL